MLEEKKELSLHETQVSNTSFTNYNKTVVCTYAVSCGRGPWQLT